MPGLAQTRSALQRAQEENDKLRAQLTELTGGSMDEIATLRQELHDARSLNQFLEGRVQVLEKQLEGAGIGNQQPAPSGDSEEASTPVAGTWTPPDPSVYESWTTAKMQEELRGRELPTSGSKPQLMQRLIDSDRRDAEEAKTA